jgi:hypothetical protein
MKAMGRKISVSYHEISRHSIVLRMPNYSTRFQNSRWHSFQSAHASTYCTYKHL